MNYLSVEKLTKSFGDRLILDHITFGIAQGQKVALVGVNGSGKSTLLKVITGMETPDSGEVVFKNDIVVKHLLQNPQFYSGQKVLDAVFDSNNPEHALLKQYERALVRSAAGHENHGEVQQLIEQIDAQNLWDLESQAKQILGKLGIHNLEEEVALLSGGQQKRIALASVLIQKPDLLILDEPTNHLDIDTIEWLEKYLAVANMALILVTHDRYFLEQVTDNIIELEAGKAFTYQGNYAYFLEKKAEREANESASIDKARNLYRKELEWIRRQPQARGTKAKYRVDAFQETKEKAFSAQKTNELNLQANTARQGKKVLEIEKLSHGFGDRQLISDFSYTFQRQDRIGIVGPNGSGKTTFIRLITQELAPNSGYIELGPTTKFGYYRQVEDQFDPQQTVIDFAKEIAEVIEVGKGRSIPVSQFLTRFLFPPEVQYKPIGKLSGGEKRRLQLLQVLLKSPNFLVLDEPTNDLDLITLGTLENYLENFEGSLIIISHDRYFMDKLVNHLFVFDGQGQIRDFPGNYTDYRMQAAESPQVAKPTEQKKEKTKEPNERKKLSFKEQREFSQLEQQIADLEQEKSRLINEMNQVTDHEELSELAKRLQTVSDELDQKELRWLELSELT
ncbi:ABC-F family ATP-binding cassette domain-containing protein [uncultured Roseivirga sp.]|uniref:ABC-F family ATP-binding cassette domain-containing protein n=3 Tax=Roseivirga TaxID=290180 RepID=UPI002583672E|nr:ABC-F family ATP-binding cassette domain-containing protein [uncultured Roseivirga sp.]|tara:strand:- start:582 stop:2444 length:1863 start_codon:yes stop_codon:yes gene_type:complete